MKRHFYLIALALVLGVSSCNKEDDNNQGNQLASLESNVTNEVKADDLENLLINFKGDEVTIKVTDYDHSKVMAAIYRAGKKLSTASLSKSFSLKKSYELPFKVKLIIPEGVKNLELKTDELTDEEKADIEQNGIPMIAKVEIPKTVETIGSNAFKGCVSLEEVKVPESIKSIGTNAFEGCQSLTKIELPKSVETIEEAAFKGCQKLEEVKIPESVKTISSSVFEGCSSLAKVEIPQTVEKIDNNAFKGCESLLEVEIPEGVKEIGQAVFEDCKSLETINIPESIETVAEDVFKGCENLETISIPENVQIEQNFVPENITVIVNGVKSSQLEEFLKNSKDEIVTVTVLEYDHKVVRQAIAASGKRVKLIIPEGVTMIEDCKYEDFTNLKKLGRIVGVEFPKKLSYIGILAFRDCDIENLNLPNTLDSIGAAAFADCKLIQTLEIPESVYVIGQEAFYNDSSLCQVKLPSKLNKISREMFSKTSLRNITIPNTVEEIGIGAFENCYSLQSIVIPSSVKRIRNYAFANCNNLSDVKFESDPSIEVNAFLNSGYNYEPIVLEDAQALSSYLKQSTNIDAYVKVNNYNHTDVLKAIQGSNKNVALVIPEGVRYIDRDTIQNIVGSIPELVNIELPTTLTGIGDYAFKDCTGLIDINLSSITFIGVKAFQGCTGLQMVFQCYNIETIKEYAFEGCINLSMIIAWNPVYFCDYAFANTKIDYVNGYNFITCGGENVFLNTPYGSYL